MKTFKDRINGITAFDEPSSRRQKAQDRKNKPWLRHYCSQISRRVLAILQERQDLSLVKLAEISKLSSTQISSIVKGQENLTLETIYRLSKALDVELISFPSYKYNHLNTIATPFVYNSPLNQKLAFAANLSPMTYLETTGTILVDLNSKAIRFA